MGSSISPFLRHGMDYHGVFGICQIGFHGIKRI